jgi:hypothetical protein
MQRKPIFAKGTALSVIKFAARSENLEQKTSNLFLTEKMNRPISGSSTAGRTALPKQKEA